MIEFTAAGSPASTLAGVLGGKIITELPATSIVGMSSGLPKNLPDEALALKSCASVALTPLKL